VTSPVYHGYVVVPETCTEGWCLGSITEFEDPEGCNGGDAFVVAPDGTRASLIWEVGDQPLQEILPPGPDNWGVYAIGFPHATKSADDLAAAFRAILPQLKDAHARARAANS
jgi:hypothetical protein